MVVQQCNFQSVFHPAALFNFRSSVWWKHPKRPLCFAGGSDSCLRPVHWCLPAGRSSRCSVKLCQFSDNTRDTQRYLCWILPPLLLCRLAGHKSVLPRWGKRGSPVGTVKFYVSILIPFIILRFWSLQKNVPGRSWAPLTPTASWMPSDAWPTSSLLFYCRPQPMRTMLCVFYDLNPSFTAFCIFLIVDAMVTFDLMLTQVSAAVEFVKLTHPHPKVPEYVELYSRALHAILGGASVRQQAEHALRSLHVWDVCQSYSRRAARYDKVEPLITTAAFRIFNSTSNCVFQICGFLWEAAEGPSERRELPRSGLLHQRFWSMPGYSD